MYVVFMVSGVRRHVDEFFDWLDYYWYKYPFKNPNLVPVVKDASGNIMKEGSILTTGRVRYGVYGTYELCFPEEYKDMILTTLRADQDNITPNGTFKGKVKGFLGKMEIEAFRKLIGCEPIPEFKPDASMVLPPEVMQSIRIIPIGVRYDEKEWLAPNGLIMERI